MEPILTALVGNNSDLFPKILSLYVKNGAKIADITFGNGVFWKHVDKEIYDFHPSDIKTGIDYNNLPYPNGSFDCLVFDPPYLGRGGGSMYPVGPRYNNLNITGTPTKKNRLLINRYMGGVNEGKRVLKINGILIIKCQDEIQSGSQQWNHIYLIENIEEIGFKAIDLFILVRSTPPTMRHKYQLHARKNHSYFIVFKKEI